eukprot:363171-Chlamydomonas_euryale.AAC.6
MSSGRVNGCSRSSHALPLPPSAASSERLPASRAQLTTSSNFVPLFRARGAAPSGAGEDATHGGARAAACDSLGAASCVGPCRWLIAAATQKLLWLLRSPTLWRLGRRGAQQLRGGPVCCQAPCSSSPDACDSARLPACNSDWPYACESARPYACESARPYACESARPHPCDSARPYACEFARLYACKSATLYSLPKNIPLPLVGAPRSGVLNAWVGCTSAVWSPGRPRPRLLLPAPLSRPLTSPAHRASRMGSPWSSHSGDSTLEPTTLVGCRTQRGRRSCGACLGGSTCGSWLRAELGSCCAC